MAKAEHVAVLEQGTVAWNTWRQQHRDIEPDLTGLLLRHDLKMSVRDLYDSGYFFDQAEKNEFGNAVRSGSIKDDPYWSDSWAIRSLRDINFARANLSRATLVVADLSRADLRQADLSGADLQDANLTDAVLTGARLDGASFGDTIFSNSDLTDVSGLLSCRHTRPSPIDYRTLIRSGQLPKEFLLNAG